MHIVHPKRRKGFECDIKPDFIARIMERIIIMMPEGGGGQQKD